MSLVNLHSGKAEQAINSPFFPTFARSGEPHSGHNPKSGLNSASFFSFLIYLQSGKLKQPRNSPYFPFLFTNSPPHSGQVPYYDIVYLPVL